MNGRRDYARLGAGISVVVGQVRNGHWNHSTTEFLMRRAIKCAGLKEDDYFTPSPKDGDLRNFGLTECILERLRTVRMSIALPASTLHPLGRVIRVREIQNVATGKPLDQKRAEEDDSYARQGLWVLTQDLTVEEAARVKHGYTRRRHDAKPDEVTIVAIETVLARHPARTVARDVWPEIVHEIDQAM